MGLLKIYILVNGNNVKTIDEDNENVKNLEPNAEIELQVRLKNIFDKSAINFSYKEVSISTILKHSYIKNNNARQLFLNNGILAFLPLSNYEEVFNNRFWIAYAIAGDDD